MSSHQANTNKSRSLKCRHFCLRFDIHNYWPSCREAGKGDDRCVTNEKPCNICSSFLEEQLLRIKNRRRYVRKQIADTSNDKLDLLWDDVEAFSGSHADLEDAAEQLYSPHPRPQSLRLERLSLKTPQTVPPTSGTALQNRIESKLEKSLGSQFNIQLQQQMGVFQASVMEAMQSVRDKIKSVKKSSEAGVDEISSSDPKPGTSKQTDDLPFHLNTQPNTQLNIQTSEHTDEPMETDFCGPALPPKFSEENQSELGSDPNRLDQSSEQSKCVCSVKAKKHSDKRKHKVHAKYVSESSLSEKSQSSVQVKKSSRPKRAPSEQDKQQIQILFL